MPRGPFTSPAARVRQAETDEAEADAERYRQQKAETVARGLGAIAEADKVITAARTERNAALADLEALSAGPPPTDRDGGIALAGARARYDAWTVELRAAEEHAEAMRRQQAGGGRPTTTVRPLGGFPGQGRRSVS